MGEIFLMSSIKAWRLSKRRAFEPRSIASLLSSYGPFSELVAPLRTERRRVRDRFSGRGDDCDRAHAMFEQIVRTALHRVHRGMLVSASPRRLRRRSRVRVA